MIGVFEGIIAHQDRGESCMLVSAVGGEGSAPRKTQSHMLVNQTGWVCGTVGGGAVEGNSIVYAKQLLGKNSSGLKQFELYDHAAEDIGMVCGGNVKVHFKYISPEDSVLRSVALAATEALKCGENAWLIIDISKHRMSLFDGMKVIGFEVPQETLDMRSSASVSCSLGESRYYAEQLAYSDRVYIFGGGHVAQALVPVLAAVDFRCVVIEDRDEFCRRDLFPRAQDVRLLTQREWKENLRIEKSDCICIMTRGHQNDLACQAFALETKAGYIGVIGSRRKIAHVNEQLRMMGFDEEQIARIVTPIGLEIGAVTPAEIAVSIAAQMIAHRASGRNAKKSCMA